MIEVRTVDWNAPDVDQVLDACHALSVENMRPKWSCPGQPHPSRGDFARMKTDGRSSLVVAYEDGSLVGWNFHDPSGHIMGAGLRHGALDGDGDVMDAASIARETAMAEQIRRNVGAVFHMSFGNPRQWHALEVQCGIPPSPLPQYAEFVDQGPPDPTGF